MPRFTTTTGTLLIILGIAGYFGTGMASLTALIPAAFGIVFFLLGRMALYPARRKKAINLTIGFALLGAIGSNRGLIGLITALTDGTSPSTAQWLQTVMAILCLALFVMGVMEVARNKRR